MNRYDKQMPARPPKLFAASFAAGPVAGLVASLAVTATLFTFPAAAQPSTNAPAPGPFQGMMNDQKKDQPVQIEAATLEVRDKNKTATFSGNVQVVQGDTTMKCQKLVVFYGQEMGIAGSDKQAAAAPVTTSKSTPGMPQGAQNIQRIEAHGGVTVVTKDQNASGDLGIYDLKTKTITLSGNVVVSQGPNVIHGEKVVVDTVTGYARVESGSSNSGAGAGAPGPGRVRALIQPGKGQGGGSNVMTIGPGPTN
jgi:lipopolysaccharide export system protein LptA